MSYKVDMPKEYHLHWPHASQFGTGGTWRDSAPEKEPVLLFDTLTDQKEIRYCLIKDLPEIHCKSKEQKLI